MTTDLLISALGRKRALESLILRIRNLATEGAEGCDTCSQEDVLEEIRLATFEGVPLETPNRDDNADQP